MDVFRGLLDHYQEIANAFEDQELARRLYPQAVEKGPSGPGLVAAFLNSHLPDRCQIVNDGFVFDASGGVSCRIDLIVASDLSVHLRHSDTSYHCLEGSHCAMSVKDKLDRNGLVDALEKLSSLPVGQEIPQGMEFLFGGKKQGILLKVVFAFEGTDPEDSLACIEEYFTANKVPDGAKPNLIVVNNRYGIVRTGDQGAVTTSGVEIPANSFHAYGRAEDEPCIGGYSLMYLLTEIQRAVSSGSQATIDYGDYLDQLPL